MIILLLVHKTKKNTHSVMIKKRQGNKETIPGERLSFRLNNCLVRNIIFIVVKRGYCSEIC